MIGYLALEDGTVMQGTAFGSEGRQFGEVVFNTSMTGYQKILTDPSYCGQIVVLTYPLVGNYGINKEDYESARPWVQGFVIKELCDYPSNWRYWIKLEEFLQKYDVIGLAGIDTRALTRRLRNYGTMRGVIATGDQDTTTLVQAAQSSPSISGQDLITACATKEIQTWGDGPLRVVVVDFGVKQNIVRSLVQRGCTVKLAPPATTAEEIMNCRPHGVVLTNGPGDPKDVWYAVETARQLIGKCPVMGICLGHQILGLAFGGDTYKLKFGHRGANHPVKDLATGKIAITSQNHGFAVDDKSLPNSEVVISHRNLNDGTVEGLQHKTLPVFSVQYHPEGSPGPMDSTYLFDRFLALIQ
ncbi:MAG: glutamine-hydrolyzing carbamoyl-phosphate synthase small subunit [Thermacetogeniaceae bacterium]